ncbi:hypothetical protein BDV26DRAFT_255135 [Aspergillus bertholletiae]|uniref:Uncharacterized protein n=1 Tax=Aspergillus bertholletiae TaxID=1226010 RepID=A0A5N7BIH0_9EURO|nr:hypothetical protein BDV26DRAFT_255135 [Aspergillus bertholletiae]
MGASLPQVTRNYPPGKNEPSLFLPEVACLNPLPRGFVGQISIGGPQVAHGYWNRTEVNC